MGSLQDLWKSSSMETLAESSLDLAKYWSILARSSMSIRAAFFVFVLVLTCEAFQQIWNDIRGEIGGASKMPLKLSWQI